MSVFQVLIILSALFAFFQLFRIKQKGAKWITVAVAVTAILAALPWWIIAKDGYIAHMIALFAAIIYIYSPRSDEPNLEQKVISTVVVLFPLVTMLSLFILRSPNGIPALQISCVISLGALIYAIVKKKSSYSNDIGYLAVAAMESFVHFSSGILSLAGS